MSNLKNYQFTVGVEANAYYKNSAGTGVYIRSLVSVWQKNNPDVQLLLYAHNRPSQMDLGKKKNVLKRILNGFRDIFWMQIILPIKLIRDRVDVLFCPAFLGPVFSPCPKVINILDLSFIRYPQVIDRLYRFFLKCQLPLVISNANVILGISELSKKEIVELFKISPEKVKVTYLACGPEYKVIEDPQQIENIKKKYSLPEKFIIHVGTLEPRKNIPNLISAFGILKKNNLFEHKLAIVGGRGWYYEKIFEKVTELKLEKEVIFTGFVPEKDLPLLYNAADVFVFPSIYEAFSMPILEAMACGCPVICSRAASLPEIGGEAAVYFNPQNPEEIAAAILKVVSNENLKKELSLKGLAQAQKFSWEKAAAETLKVLIEAAGEEKK